MTSKLPAGHYQNMITAIRNLATARDRARASIRTATETNEQLRLGKFRKMQSDASLKRK